MNRSFAGSFGADAGAVPLHRSSPRRLRLAVRCVAALAGLGVVGLTLGTPAVEARMRYVRAPYPGSGTAPAMEAAIAAVFPSSMHRQALNVAWCESRGRATARNGQYRGHFQMGAREWRRFGSGNPFNAVDNSRAAYRYYLAVGSWRPWQCQP